MPYLIFLLSQIGSKQWEQLEFSSLLEGLATFNSQLVSARDLNVYFEKPDSPEVIRLTQLLNSFALVQHVDQPTHKLGGFLDVIITWSKCSLRDLRVGPPSISDYGPDMCSIPFAYLGSALFISIEDRKSVV